jgi:hypothetical protein
MDVVEYMNMDVDERSQTWCPKIEQEIVIKKTSKKLGDGYNVKKVCSFCECM